MRKAILVFRILVFLSVGGFLHYVLPQHDIARIISTEVVRTDFSWYNRIFHAQTGDSNAPVPNRDLRLINTERKKSYLLGFIRRDAEGIMVYRNEDTGWIWPPYFKFDSSDLQARAETSADPSGERQQWVSITHYGWRNRFLSVYPNAVHIRPVEGPDATIIPWFNICFFVVLIAAWLYLRRVWRRFRERRLDPVMDRAATTFEDVGEHADDAIGRARGIRVRFGDWLAERRNRFRR